MLRVLFAEAEVELVPPEIAGHPAVRKAAQALGKRAGQVLLDQNLHRPAMSALADADRRGRPDIVQYSLLLLLEGPLAKAGQLEAAFHTRHGELVRVRPDTRLPRGEGRFQGLVAKVLAEGRSQERDPLLWVEARCEAKEALERFAQGTVVRLDETAAAGTPESLVEGHRDLTLVVGAYPSGAWSQAWQEAAPEAASVWPEPLNAWTVASECASAYRRRWLVGP